MLHNAYAADLGAADLGAVSALIVHYADGTTARVANDLRAPGA
jgi:hypothetical protein